MQSTDQMRTPEVARVDTWKSVGRFARKNCDEVVGISVLHDEALCSACWSKIRDVIYNHFGWHILSLDDTGTNILFAV